MPIAPAAFADALIELADHREHLPEMGQRSRALALRKFCQDLLFERMLGLIQELSTRDFKEVSC